MRILNRRKRRLELHPISDCFFLLFAIDWFIEVGERNKIVSGEKGEK